MDNLARGSILLPWISTEPMWPPNISLMEQLYLQQL